MISIDMKAHDVTSILDPATGRRKLIIGGVDLHELNSDAVTAMAMALGQMTSKKIRVLILEAGEEFPDLLKARKPHVGEGCDPFS